jgi:hypothetical protein
MRVGRYALHRGGEEEVGRVVVRGPEEVRAEARLDVQGGEEELGQAERAGAGVDDTLARELVGVEVVGDEWQRGGRDVEADAALVAALRGLSGARARVRDVPGRLELVEESHRGVSHNEKSAPPTSPHRLTCLHHTF